MAMESDIDALGDWLDGVIDEIGWDIPGPDGHGTLADATVEVLIDGQQARARSQYGLDQEWADNEDDYRKEKASRYGDQPPNYRTHQMLSRESLKGRVEAGHDAAAWTYGTGTPSPNGKTKHDRTVTDTDKAWYANEDGQSEKKVKREFFGITAEDADDALLAVEQGIVAHLERKANEA